MLGSLACRLESLLAVASPQSRQSQTGSIALLRVRPAPQDLQIRIPLGLALQGEAARLRFFQVLDRRGGYSSFFRPR